MEGLKTGGEEAVMDGILWKSSYCSSSRLYDPRPQANVLRIDIFGLTIADDVSDCCYRPERLQIRRDMQNTVHLLGSLCSIAKPNVIPHLT